MTEASRPWNGTVTGDAGPYSDSDWQELYTGIIGYGAGRANNGVFLSSGTVPNDGLKVEATNPATTSVNVLRGAALIQGIAYLSDATEAFIIAANASGNPRIDTIVLQADYALQTVRLVVLQGTPAASPSAPSLTQTPNVLWEIPIADIAVANGFISINNSNITQRQEWVNAPTGTYLDGVINNSGAALNSGDLVVWDSTADRAVKTSTTRGDITAAGVWAGGAIAAAGYGRVLTEGIGYIQTDAAVTRGDRLVIGSTAKKTSANVGSSGVVVARALETTSGAGYALCYIHVERLHDDYVLIQDQKAQNTAGGTATSGSFQKRDLNTEVVDTGGVASLASSVLTLQPGTYRARWTCPAANAVLLHQSRLRNTSDTIDYYGTPGRAGANIQDRSEGAARFTITAAKNFELQHQVGTTIVTNGFGFAGNFGTEVYSILELWREGF
jgi:hypothetical protein